MLPRTQRLRESRHFDAAYRLGKRWGSAPLVLYTQRNHALTSRLGIVASRKVGNAVIRNRLKRLIREVFRARWLDLAPGFNLVVVLQAKAQGMSLREMDAQLLTLLGRAEVLGGNSRGNHL